MKHVFQHLYGKKHYFLSLIFVMLLGACSSNLPGLDPFSEQKGNENITQIPPPDALNAATTKVALILPLSAPGNAGLAALSMRNAGEQALAEFQDPTIQLIIKDDAGDTQTAKSRTQEALSEGAQLILGPLFAQSVQAASQEANARGVTVIGFSTDANVAQSGTYLLSFLPQNDVNRIVSHTVKSGKRTIAALIPNSAYGAVAEAALKQQVSQSGGTIIAIGKYDEEKDSVAQAVGNMSNVLSGSKAQANALFIADAGAMLPEIVQALQQQSFDTKKVQIIGTGLWNDPNLWRQPFLNGAWFVAPDTNGYNAFADRYKTRYGQSPSRVASLSYDAVSLAAALAKTKNTDRFAKQTLTNPQGFAGLDGIFRFMPNGTSERGLAIMRITPQGPQVVSPSPKSF